MPRSPAPDRATAWRRSRGTASGFSLIEVLVALLILAIGLMGVAAMQVRGLRFNHEANLRSQAAFIANEIADRIRLNPSAAASYVGNYTSPQTNNCDMDAAVSAANDLACWRELVDEVLPSGSEANISTDGTNYTINILIATREDANGDGVYEKRTVPYVFRP